MKTRKEHVKADLFLLGYSVPWVHEFIDSPVSWMGAGHRSNRHNIAAIEYVGEISAIAGEENRQKAKTVALLHLLIDCHVVPGKLINEFIKKEKETRRKG